MAGRVRGDGREIVIPDREDVRREARPGTWDGADRDVGGWGGGIKDRGAADFVRPDGNAIGARGRKGDGNCCCAHGAVAPGVVYVQVEPPYPGWERGRVAVWWMVAFSKHRVNQYIDIMTELRICHGPVLYVGEDIDSCQISPSFR